MTDTKTVEQIDAEMKELADQRKALLEKKKISIIGISLEAADFRKKDDWQRQFEWLATNLEKFDAVFRKRVKELQL